MGTVYASLGSKIVLAEAMENILMGADKDLILPVKKYAEKKFEEIRVGVKVLEMATEKKQIKVTMEYEGKQIQELYDRVLVCVGRRPNGENLGLENTSVTIDAKGFIEVDASGKTHDSNIFAIGDVVGGAMLAHKATREARLAVETILGESAQLKASVIPAVVFTDPEIAWCGLTENEARAKNIPIKVSRFPWAASGRAMSFDRIDGLTKLIIEPETERVLGVGIVGSGAGELIGEGVFAIEMGATARDLAESMHPHPTLSETIMECAEAFYGHSTHTFVRKRR